jgi:hypothetical protein
MTATSAPRLPSPNIQFRFFDEHGKEVAESYDPEFATLAAEPLEVRDMHERLIGELCVKKPKWFEESEFIARRFLRQAAGITSWAPSYLLKEDPMLDDIGLREPPTTVAASDPFVGHIMVRYEKMRRHFDRTGLYGVAGTMVHERWHAETPLKSIDLQKSRDGDIIASGRSGLATIGNSDIQGMFFEEGGGVLLQAMCMRKQRTLSLAVSNEAPPYELPYPYTRISQSEPEDELRIAGPDGYAMELLALGAEQRGITTAHDFVRVLIASRQLSLQPQALKRLPIIINAIRPGLYRQLRMLQYGHEDWQKGLQLVHEAVAA